ncbi:hypothetical protein J3Q64DRAFT_1693182 [Phycomyces blakesleeanus]|uniref:Uncharacterized protein n=2 Tax=Phycomyces blakesleeanus TaxID=4837 RepID=A0A162N3D0_PHYB8|nr:hypothetical protein PHYBLDRAFT_69182 [Phycomyces blakesleeanus NRRL 1555(-)]OAD68108.1 hypothetical protein PHYBLDRAFT_69182 [Phycomyces blakesleeanus NRRL 1555(-)]|eukprot:XP_018286148.1 hypothetical protein PHYBLDRAFT_69182 [Phycomyces blakesleeanus NRRL 1555(-)]
MPQRHLYHALQVVTAVAAAALTVAIIIRVACLLREKDLKGLFFDQQQLHYEFIFIFGFFPNSTINFPGARTVKTHNNKILILIIVLIDSPKAVNPIICKQD